MGVNDGWDEDLEVKYNLREAESELARHHKSFEQISRTIDNVLEWAGKNKDTATDLETGLAMFGALMLIRGIVG